MFSDRARTRFEFAIALLFTAIAASFVKVGQAGETPSKHHSRIDCSFCHTPVADVASDEMPVFDGSRQCGNCHQRKATDDKVGLTFHAASSKRCTDCHSFHETEQITAAGETFRFRFDRQSSQMTLCGSCHAKGENPTMISDGHQKASILYHADHGILAKLTPSQACMLCHEQNASRNAANEGLTVPQFQQHNDHPLSVKVVAGSGEPGNRIRFAIDSRLPLFDGKIECQTCHSLSSQSKGRLRDFSSFTELCKGCHLVD